MAKDAGSSRIFQPESKGGRGWKWITNRSRPTNRNLAPLFEQLPGGKLYASFLGPLLRNDNQESGSLLLNERIRAFVRDLFRWTVSEMPNLRVVAVLGADAWRELALAAGLAAESKRWKQRHISGTPLNMTVEGRAASLVALNHPARIPSSKLMQQPGWQWIVQSLAKRKQ